MWGICDGAPTPAARGSSPTVTATAVSTSALATMSAAAAHSGATAVRISGSVHAGGGAWRQERPSPVPGVGTPSYPANVGILDTTIHATRGPDPNTRTATVQPEPPTRSACANTGRNNELTKQQRPGMGARVRPLVDVRSCCSLSRCRSLFVLRIENFLVSLSFARRRRRQQPRERIKKRIKIARLVIFSSRIPPRG